MSRHNRSAPAAIERPALDEGGAMYVDPQRFPADGYGIAPDWWKRYLCLRLVVENGSDSDKRNPLAKCEEFYAALERENFGAHTANAAQASDSA